MNMPSDEDRLAHKRDSKRKEGIAQLRRALLTAADGLRCFQEADAIQEKIARHGLAQDETTCYTQHK